MPGASHQGEDLEKQAWVRGATPFQKKPLVCVCVCTPYQFPDISVAISVFLSLSVNKNKCIKQFRFLVCLDSREGCCLLGHFKASCTIQFVSPVLEGSVVCLRITLESAF